jgi:hypothetical protein
LTKSAQLGCVDGQVIVIGHNGLDPGVFAVAAHHATADTTIVVLGNQDHGSRPVYLRLAAEWELTDPRT